MPERLISCRALENHNHHSHMHSNRPGPEFRVPGALQPTIVYPPDQTTMDPVEPVLANDDSDETSASAKGVKREYPAHAREVKREKTAASASSSCQRTLTCEKPLSPSQRRRTMLDAMTKRSQSNAKAKAQPRVKAKAKQLGTLLVCRRGMQFASLASNSLVSHQPPTCWSFFIANAILSICPQSTA